MDITEKIKGLRKQRNLSQKQVADLVGISQAAYAKIESGKTTKISIADGQEIAKALGVSFLRLFDINNPDDFYTEELRQKSSALEKLFQEVKKENERHKEHLDLLSETNRGLRLHLGVKEKMLEILFDKLTSPDRQYPFKITVFELQKEAFEQLQKELPELYGNLTYNPYTGAYEARKV